MRATLLPLWKPHSFVPATSDGVFLNEVSKKKKREVHYFVSINKDKKDFVSVHRYKEQGAGIGKGTNRDLGAGDTFSTIN